MQHGLSYTTFEYSGLTVDATSAAPAVLIALTVKNSGAVWGKASAQLYISFPPAAGEPPQQLRDFAMLPLAPGESMGVSFTLDERARSIWAVDGYKWVAVPGQFTVSVGASSRDLRVTGTFTV